MKKKLLPSNPVVEERNRIIEKMKTLDPTSEEYEKAQKSLIALTAALGVDKKNKLDMNTIATLGVQGGIFALVYFLTKTDILPGWIRQWFPKGRV
jgi:hypothetical protein